MLLVATKQAAEMLGVSRVTLWRWTRRGRISSVRIGRLRRYRVSELERFISSHDRPGIIARRNRR